MASRMKELSEIHQEEVRKMLARFQAQRQEIALSLPPAAGPSSRTPTRSPGGQRRQAVSTRAQGGASAPPSEGEDAHAASEGQRDDFASMRRERDR
jgi:hypothetical protein